MFCRFCGAHIPDDSLFCARCGKRLSARESPEDSLFARLYLKTPYPWAALLFITFVGWALWPGPDGVDFSALEFALEVEAESSAPGDDLFRHYLSLVVENTGTLPVSDIAVQLRVTMVPEQPVEVVSEFRGGRFTVLRDGVTLPVVLILTDEIAAREKRRFPIDNAVTTTPPAQVTYTIVRERSGEALASLTAQLGDAPEDGPPVRSDPASRRRPQ